MDISMHYTKKRSHCGVQPMFCEQGPEMLDSISVNKQEHRNYILRNPIHEMNQNTPDYAAHSINTFRPDYATTGVNHSEGGWPKDLNILDPEAVQRYRRRVEKDDDYIHCVMELAPPTEHYLNQNNAIDMYRSYYAEMNTQPPVEQHSIRITNVFRDPHNRPVSSIAFPVETAHQFAVTYADINFYLESKNATTSFLWELERPLAPLLGLSPPCVMVDLQYGPRDPTLLVGALTNGQVAQFDVRASRIPVQVSPSHERHRGMVRNVLFINSKSGMEFFSGGMDGVCKWWDLRYMKGPTDEMIIDVCTYSFEVQSIARAHGISVLEYEPTIPTRFMVGTENGHVVCGNRKGKSPLEKLPAMFEKAQLGPVHNLERNPAFAKNFLTVGDWSAKVWSEECRDSPILWTPMHGHKITWGCWSPTRISLMLLTGMDGKIALWDILRKHHEPILTMQIGTDPLLKARFHESGALCAVGNKKGRVYMVEMSQSLQETGYRDKLLLTALFERETKRERILEARLREIKMKRRQAEEKSPAVSLTDMEYITHGDRDLIEAAAEYHATVKRELSTM